MTNRRKQKPVLDQVAELREQASTELAQDEAHLQQLHDDLAAQERRCKQGRALVDSLDGITGS